MAYTLHWTNSTTEIWRDPQPDEDLDIVDKDSPLLQKSVRSKHGHSAFNYLEKIGSLTPVLSLQADVLYPNALASVCERDEGENDEEEEIDAMAVGCIGNQIDKKFPLESRTPTCIPLVQYPTKTNGNILPLKSLASPYLDDCDICAIPVVNWDHYIKRIKGIRGMSQQPRKETRKITTTIKKLKQMAEGIKQQYEIENEESDIEMDIDQEYKASNVSAMASTSTFIETQNKLFQQDMYNSKTEQETNEVGNEMEERDEEKEKDDTRKGAVGKMKRKRRRKAKFQLPKHVNQIQPRIFQSYSANPDDLEEVVASKSTDQRYSHLPHYLKEQILTTVFKQKSVYHLPSEVKDKFESVPDLRVQGTWNYLYNQKGACDWTYDSNSKDTRVLLVGKGTKLRAVRLKRASRASKISYALENIWDEQVTGPPPLSSLKTQDDYLNDVIFQIVSHKSESLAAVRRGRRIDFYNTSDAPVHLTSIPIYGYSQVYGYSGFVKYSYENPKFLAFDLNPYNPREAATLDENFVLQYHDFTAEKSTSGISAVNDDLALLRMGTRNSVFDHDKEHLSINRAAGITYANDPSTMYYYYNSKVYFYDKREKIHVEGVRQVPDFHPLLNLQYDTAARALSDQRYFSHVREDRLLEYVSCVQRSQNSNYYYIGTSSRIFLMDWRVPKNPVIKMSHGMKSPATYIDTNYNKNFEVVVAGSQRCPEVFSAVLDYAHVKCTDRLGCKARNPILTSYPRHLFNSGDFIDKVFEDGLQLSWPSENARVQNHCNAWSTGLSICPLPSEAKLKKPPGTCVFSTNNYGDVFYQEWLREPVENYRKLSREDGDWIEFVKNWRSSMRLKRENKSSTSNSSNNPIPNSKIVTNKDCSRFIEPPESELESLTSTSTKKQNYKFNPFKPKKKLYQKTIENVKSIQDNSAILKKFKGDRVGGLVSIWENDWKIKTPTGLFKQAHPSDNEEVQVEEEVTAGQATTTKDSIGDETTLNPSDNWFSMTNLGTTTIKTVGDSTMKSNSNVSQKSEEWENVEIKQEVVEEEEEEEEQQQIDDFNDYYTF